MAAGKPGSITRQPVQGGDGAVIIDREDSAPEPVEHAPVEIDLIVGVPLPGHRGPHSVAPRELKT